MVVMPHASCHIALISLCWINLIKYITITIYYFLHFIYKNCFHIGTYHRHVCNISQYRPTNIVCALPSHH